MDLSRLSLKEITQVVCDVMDVSMELLIKDAGVARYALVRSMIAYYAHYFGGYSFNEVALSLFYDAQALSEMMHQTISSPPDPRQIEFWMKNIEHAFWFKIIELNLSGD